MTLADALDRLYETYGFYRNDLCSFTFEGAEGMAAMAGIMEGLRRNPPKVIAGREVEAVTDYKLDETGLPKSDVLEYRLAGGAKFIARPSGTEPKIKAYLSAVGSSEEASLAVLAELKKAAKEIMQP